MKTKKLSYYLLATVSVLTLLSTSCSKNSNNPAMPTPTPVVVTGFKLTTNVTLGNIITDNNGMAVYFFSKDVAGTPTCVDACAVKWPPFYKENPTIGTGLSATDFGVVTRTDGSKQTTYKGWPLHYFSGDVNAADANGDAFGNLWAVAKADYSVMFGNQQLVGLDGASYTDQSIAGTGASTFLTDPTGHTLYMFTKDTHATNTFTKADLSNNTVWPMDEVTTIGSIPTVLDKTQFTTITVFAHTQLVFKGHPLYQFGQDAGVRGSTKGVSFPTPGSAIWKVTNNTTVVL